MMQSSYSFEAISSLRIHKGFIQELIDKNGMTLNNMNPFKINIDSLIDETEVKKSFKQLNVDLILHKYSNLF